MRQIRNIFLAGKITGNDWRRDILKRDIQMLPTNSSYPCVLHEYAECAGLGNSFDWPVWEKSVLGMFNYVGPFYVGCKRYGEVVSGDPYAVYEDEDLEMAVEPITKVIPISTRHHLDRCSCNLSEEQHNHGCWTGEYKRDIGRLCKQRIEEADLVFAWIDDLTAYATLFEVGQAIALDKLIVTAGPHIDDLELIYEVVGFHQYNKTPLGAFLSALDHMFCYQNVTVDYELLSPIEARFLAEWNRLKMAKKDRLGLFPQYPVLNYRVDFASVDQRIAIELDGLEAHKTTAQIAHDRKRQREIEAAGWRVIRFGGKEIHHNVSECVLETREIVLSEIDKQDKARSAELVDLFGEE